VVAKVASPAATVRQPLATTWAMVGGRMVQVPLSPAAAAARAALPVAVAEGAPGQPPMPSGPLPANAPVPILNFVKLVAPEYNLAPQLVLAIMATESGFHAGALSPKNAQGLMQLIPETAARFGVRNPMDPAQNIRGGMAYLRWLLAYFQGDVALVAAAYNAGEGAVERYRGVPPYAETLNYVAKVLPAVGALRHPWDPRATAPSDRLALMRDAIRVR
jgi:soluble lytic murein transglycosylase-like protein